MAVERIEGCIGCGTCVKSYSTDVLRLDPKARKASIKYLADCQIQLDADANGYIDSNESGGPGGRGSTVKSLKFYHPFTF